MRIVRHTSTVVEKLVVIAEWGESDLVKLLDPNLPEHEGWILDWHQGYKFVLKRHRDYTVLIENWKEKKMSRTDQLNELTRLWNRLDDDQRKGVLRLLQVIVEEREG